MLRTVKPGELDNTPGKLKERKALEDRITAREEERARNFAMRVASEQELRRRCAVTKDEPAYAEFALVATKSIWRDVLDAIFGASIRKFGGGR